jgi:hypothetical protein
LCDTERSRDRSTQFCASKTAKAVTWLTLMQIMQLSPGSQDMAQGVVVILVLALAGRDAIRTGSSRSLGATQ